jgi:uncharacterized membrane protein YfcA
MGNGLLDLVLGGGVVALTAFLGGVTGFGAALASTPFLLSIGFPLDFVVTVNLALLLCTRISVSYRLRKHLLHGTVVMLVLGSVPGIYLGVRALGIVEASTIKFATGILVIVAAAMLLRTGRGRAAPRSAVVPLLAGLAGGFLGSTTSLSGIPPAIALAREEIEPSGFLSTLAVYFVFSSGIALALLAAQGVLVQAALFPAAALWLPGALFGNFLGVNLAGRLPTQTFRRLTCGVIFIAGVVTIYTS